MPVFIAALLGGLVSAAGSLVGRVLIALGVGFVSYQGLDVALTFVKTQTLAAISSMPPEVFQIASTLQLGTAINIMASAYVAKMTIAGLTSGVVKKMVFK
jgi:hypothetical protein